MEYIQITNTKPAYFLIYSKYYTILTQIITSKSAVNIDNIIKYIITPDIDAASSINKQKVKNAINKIISYDYYKHNCYVYNYIRDAAEIYNICCNNYNTELITDSLLNNYIHTYLADKKSYCRTIDLFIPQILNSNSELLSDLIRLVILPNHGNTIHSSANYEPFNQLCIKYSINNIDVLLDVVNITSNVLYTVLNEAAITKWCNRHDIKFIRRIHRDGHLLPVDKHFEILTHFTIFNQKLTPLIDFIDTVDKKYVQVFNQTFDKCFKAKDELPIYKHFYPAYKFEINNDSLIDAVNINNTNAAIDTLYNEVFNRFTNLAQIVEYTSSAIEMGCNIIKELFDIKEDL